jgi:hypothetical protein
MGLDAFLIPQQPASTKVARSLNSLGEALASPPINVDAPEAGPELTDVPHETTPPSESPSQTSPHAHGREALALMDRAGLPPAFVAEVVISPPEIKGRGTAPEPASSELPSVEGPIARFDGPTSATFGDSEKLGDFLTTAGDSIAPPRGEVDRVDADLISTSPLMELDQASDAAAPAYATVRDQWREPSPPRPTNQIHRWEEVASIPSRTNRFSDGVGGGLELGDETERIEERLSQVATRLEQAVERLGSPSLPLGQRPRPFRGRIDG